MIRLALLAAAVCAVCRMIPRIVDENRTRALLPAPSPDNRPPNPASLASSLERGGRNG
jgi:hypothetical protein